MRKGGAITAFAVGLCSVQAGAVCTISPEGVLFAPYDTLLSSATDGVGTIEVDCDSPTSFTIGLGEGGGTIEARQMSGGTQSLGYNLYSDVSRQILWGDGVSAGSTVSASGTAVDLPVYGRIPARQNVPAGQYSDMVVVTVEF